jgi:CBS domain-containing protein
MLGRAGRRAISGWRLQRLTRRVQYHPLVEARPEQPAAVLVEDLESGDPVSVEPEAPALRALDLMVDEGVRHLPVVDPRRHVVGVISLDDLTAALRVPVSLHQRLGDRARRDVWARSGSAG